jgi:hypothetical protein
MKKTGKIITAILMVLFAGCADIFDPPEVEGSATGMGQALLSIGPQGVRTIMPTDYQDVTYTYEFIKGQETVSGAISSGTARVDLEPGTWTLLVQGFLDGTAILEGRETDIVISLGEQTPVSVSLAGIPEGEPGSLDYTVTFPDTVISGFLRVYQWDKEGLKTPQVDLLDGATRGEGTKTRTGFLSLPVGYYRVALDLVIAGTPGKVLSKTEIAHIYPGLTTQAAFTAEIEDFMSTPGTVDGSQTTLAAALGTISDLASGTDVVYVLSPGDESMASTEVSNAIGPVTVTIDGGGREVTLTNAGSLINVGDNVTLVFRNITLKGRGLGVTNNDTLIRVERGGTLELGTGSKITGNNNASDSYRSSYGGGVYVAGSFTMSGGEISDNTSSYYTTTTSSYSSSGGGVYVGNGGSFTMSGGEISGNTSYAYSSPSSYYSYSYGGGVYVAGSFTMSGGEISGNTSYASYSYSYSYGGGVYVAGSFTMNGGEISDNTSSSTSGSSGGGVYVAGSFTMNGGEISGNTSYSYSSSGGGVYVGNGGSFTMSGGEISGNTSSSYSSNSSKGSGVSVGDGGSFTMSGGKISDNTSSYSPSGGGVYVAGSFTMSDGEISGNSGSEVYVAGTFTMSGGKISGNSGSEVYVAGTFTMSGGKISDNTSSSGGGVYVGNGGTFIMSGGESSGKTSYSSTYSSGGGVYVAGSFTMSGGEISGNTSSAPYSYGGGVYVAGSFTMSGGEISGNTSYSSGGGVYVDNRGSFTMSGGEISGNTSSAGGGVYVDNRGSFTMSGGEISGNTSSAGGGVYVDNGGTFTMSGGARVNVNNPVCLYYSFSSSSYPSITIGGDFSGPTGPVAQIDLQADNDTPWSTWLGHQVIKTDYSGNVAVLRNRFTLGNFIGRTGSSGSYTYPNTPITDTGYEIGSDGTLRAVTP